MENKTEWKKVKLKDVIEFNPKETLKKGTLAKYIEMANLQCFQKNILKYEIKEYKGGTKFRNGDTLLARITPCLENGKTGFVDFLEKNEIAFGSTEYIILREKANITDKNFIYYLSISEDFRNLAIKSMSGTSGRQRVQTDVLLEAEIKLPPLNIQKKIAKILSDIDEKIGLNNKINDNLEKQAELIFNNYFLKNSFSNILKRDKLLTLSKEIICGKTPATKNKEFYGADVPFITIPDMHNKIYIDSTERSLSFKGADSQNNKYLPINTICVSCIGTAGLVSLTSKISQTNQQINSVIPKETEFTYYIYFLMKSLKDKINLIGASGSTFCNLNKKDFSNLEVPIPNNKILKRFHNSISPLFEKLKENQIENEKLINLKKYLLPKLMNGEIDVENIEL
ncbi:MAG: restriction endonuclease subunit S [Fusobacterium sp.]